MVSVSVAKAPSDPSKPWAYKYFREKVLGGYHDLENLIIQHVWSGIIWDKGERAELSFRSSFFAVLDFDTPEMTLAEALNTFSDTNHIIGTTKSHQKEKNGVVCDRYRVILPFDREITDLSEYRFNMRLFYNRYPCDKCIDGARYFFPCCEVVSVVADGYKTEVVEGREVSPPPLYTKNWASLGTLPALARHARQVIIPHGKRNTFFYGVARDLIKCGYPDEYILKLISLSRTFEKCWSKDIEGEMKITISSARKRTEREVEIERCD